MFCLFIFIIVIEGLIWYKKFIEFEVLELWWGIFKILFFKNLLYICIKFFFVWILILFVNK